MACTSSEGTMIERKKEKKRNKSAINWHQINFTHGVKPYVG